MSAATGAVPVIWASLLSRSTLALSTPSTWASARSTLPRHPLHVIPSTCSVTGSGPINATSAEWPAATEAAMSASAEAVPVTVASSFSRSTLADLTPSTLASTPSTLPRQWLHIMPPMRSVIGSGGPTSSAEWPAATEAAMSAEAEAVPVTVASSFSRSTLADLTPDTSASARSTLPRQ